MIFIPAYVYKITNTITGEFYYGYRYKNIKLNLFYTICGVEIQTNTTTTVTDSVPSAR